MQLRAEEISQIIKQQIAGYDKAVDVMETGTVLTLGDGIARIYGLDQVENLALLQPVISRLVHRLWTSSLKVGGAKSVCANFSAARRRSVSTNGGAKKKGAFNVA